MRRLKYGWQYLMAQPVVWLFYYFFQTARFKRELEQEDVFLLQTQRTMQMQAFCTLAYSRSSPCRPGYVHRNSNIGPAPRHLHLQLCSYIYNEFFMSAIHFFVWSSPLFLQTWKMIQTIIPRRLATASASHTRLGRALPKLGPTSRLGTCLIMNYIILISFNAEDK